MKKLKKNLETKEKAINLKKNIKFMNFMEISNNDL